MQLSIGHSGSGIAPRHSLLQDSNFYINNVQVHRTIRCTVQHRWPTRGSRATGGSLRVFRVALLKDLRLTVKWLFQVYNVLDKYLSNIRHLVLQLIYFFLKFLLIFAN